MAYNRITSDLKEGKKINSDLFRQYGGTIQKLVQIVPNSYVKCSLADNSRLLLISLLLLLFVITSIIITSIRIHHYFGNARFCGI